MKKINLSIIAVLLGTALAFAGSKSISLPEARGLQWFQLKLNGDPGNPDDYTITDAPEGCDGSDVRCAIYSEEDMLDPGKPTQSGVDNPVIEELRATL
ncbi:hypothetical protein ACSX1A_11065 [Pontibacter sp. MBLB2868]|uniref:hypothetical protein n=1 Tax=Pontibacter sp. MBLB2868 TaxID=3451555 RepID=UPI003F754920